MGCKSDVALPDMKAASPIFVLVSFPACCKIVWFYVEKIQSHFFTGSNSGFIPWATNCRDLVNFVETLCKHHVKKLFKIV